MDGEVPLPTKVRITLPNRPVRILSTVGEAIDLIQEDIPAMTHERWHPVQEQLFRASETNAAADLAKARDLLVEALRAEGWLYGKNG